VDIFLNTEFAGSYHCTRINQIKDIENDIPIKQTPIMNKNNKHVKGE
jgi:ribose 5-phosphate isomerase B